jgi:hypothetical protein
MKKVLNAFLVSPGVFLGKYMRKPQYTSSKVEKMWGSASAVQPGEKIGRKNAGIIIGIGGLAMGLSVYGLTELMKQMENLGSESSAEYLLNFPTIYDQREPQLEEVKLGYSNLTLFSDGCLVCSLASYLKAAGVNTATPVLVNAILRDRSGFTAGTGKFIWDRGSKILGLEQPLASPEYVGDNLVPKSELEIVRKSIKLGSPLITEVDFVPKTSKQDQHFGLTIGYGLDRNGDFNYLFANPWGGLLELYGEKEFRRQAVQFYSYVNRVPFLRKPGDREVSEESVVSKEKGDLIWTGGDFGWKGLPYPGGKTHLYPENQWPDVVRWKKKVMRYTDKDYGGHKISDIVDDHVRKILALIWVESDGIPDGPMSSEGAIGLGGVISGEYIDGRPSKKDLRDPDVNIEWICRILGWRIEKYGQKLGFDRYYGDKDGDLRYSDLVFALAKRMEWA